MLFLPLSIPVIFPSLICEERSFAFALPRQTVTLQRRACAFSTVGVYNTNLKGFAGHSARLCAFIEQKAGRAGRSQTGFGPRSDTTCFLIYFSLAAAVIDPLR